MRVSFVIPGEPVAKGRPRFSTRGGFPRAFTPAKTAAAENVVRLCAKRFFAGGIMLGPVMVAAKFVMPIPASWSKKKQAEVIGKPHVSRPDSDNLMKLVLDALNGLAFEDDSQVYLQRIEKVYGKEPCTEILITDET